jgi:hypothetical protein
MLTLFQVKQKRLRKTTSLAVDHLMMARDPGHIESMSWMQNAPASVFRSTICASQLP